jgi:hypothetical protein
MTQHKHAITPPPELVEKWSNLPLIKQEIIAIAWRNGADAELEACCEWIHGETSDECFVANLRAARRPNPNTLKERGREALQSIHNAVVMETGGRELDVLKEIVESLPD